MVGYDLELKDIEYSEKDNSHVIQQDRRVS
jgi:hypothetical protein